MLKRIDLESNYSIINPDVKSIGTQLSRFKVDHNLRAFVTTRPAGQVARTEQMENGAFAAMSAVLLQADLGGYGSGITAMVCSLPCNSDAQNQLLIE